MNDFVHPFIKKKFLWGAVHNEKAMHNGTSAHPRAEMYILYKQKFFPAAQTE
jgi:hypothetical protein